LFAAPINISLFSGAETIFIQGGGRKYKIYFSQNCQASASNKNVQLEQGFCTFSIY